MAASKTHYNSYVTEQGQTMEKAQVVATGYRGEHIRMGIDAMILFPELSHTKSLAKYLNVHGSLKEKRDLIQTQATIGRDGETAIAFLVAFANVRLAIKDKLPIKTINLSSPADPAWLRLAGDFDSKLKAANVPLPNPSTFETYQMFTRLTAATGKYLNNITSTSGTGGGGPIEAGVLFVREISPSASLASILCTVLFLVVAWAFTLIQSETFRRMLPHLLCVPCWFLVLSLSTDSQSLGVNAPQAGAIIGIAQLAVACLSIW